MQIGLYDYAVLVSWLVLMELSAPGRPSTRLSRQWAQKNLGPPLAADGHRYESAAST